MNYKKLALAALAVVLTGASFIGSAWSSVLDSVRFETLGLVIVWGGDGANGAMANDFVLMTTGSGNAGADLTTGDVTPILTGTVSLETAPSSGANELSIVNPTSGGVFTDDGDGVLDAGDSLTAFGLDATTDVEFADNMQETSFFVASNTAFEIRAQAAAPTTSGDFTGNVDLSDIAYGLGITLTGDNGVAFGGNAQHPHSAGGSNGISAPATLDLMAAQTAVFTGNQRTAASPGAIASQSVRFDATYSLTNGGDLSLGVGSISTDVTYTIFVP